MSTKADINGFIEVYAEDMSDAERDLLRSIFDQWAGDEKTQDRLLDLLHSLVAMGYDDGLCDAQPDDIDPADFLS